MSSDPKPRRSRLALAAIAVVAAIPLVGANSASAANYASPYDVFNGCPVDNPDFLAADGEAGCVGAVAHEGTMKLGNMEAVLGPMVTSMGVYVTQAEPNAPVTLPGAGGNSIAAEPVTVPGGLLNMMCPGASTNVITQLCKTLADSALNKVTATAVSAGTPEFSLDPGPTVPIKIKLNNPLLGNNCYIGSDANPIVLELALAPAGDSAEIVLLPPIPGYELAGFLGLAGLKFTDETFEVPKAKGCGPLNLFDGAINNRVGLPSPSGNNSITLLGDSYIAIASSFNGIPNPGEYLHDALASTAQ